MRARYVRQWKQDDGTLVLVFNSGFRMDFGPRRMTASNAVVWIDPARSDLDGRKYYQFTVYLSENAEVREAAGTTTQDTVLLVSNLRTRGRIVKHHDAHAPEAEEDNSLYQRALVDRTLIERAAETLASGRRFRAADCSRQRNYRSEEKKPPRRINYELTGGQVDEDTGWRTGVLLRRPGVLLQPERPIRRCSKSRPTPVSSFL